MSSSTISLKSTLFQKSLFFTSHIGVGHKEWFMFIKHDQTSDRKHYIKQYFCFYYYELNAAQITLAVTLLMKNNWFYLSHPLLNVKSLATVHSFHWSCSQKLYFQFCCSHSHGHKHAYHKNYLGVYLDESLTLSINTKLKTLLIRKKKKLKQQQEENKVRHITFYEN